MRACSVPGALGAALLLAACSSESPEPASREARFQQEIAEWTFANGRLAGPGKLKLRDGRCLDLTALKPPWSIDQHPKAREMTNGVVIAAGGKEFGVRPFEPPGTLGRPFDVPPDGKLRVQVSGWSPPNPAWATYWVASPERIEENRRSGLFRKIDLWPADTSLEAYDGVGDRYYVDPRRLTQCRDYLTLERHGYRQVRCTAVSQDQSFSFSFTFDPRDVGRLPAALRRIEAAIASVRTGCATRADPATD